MAELRLLWVVKRAESLCGAARELGISQPAASQQARKLEERCGMELFDRGMYTTYLSDDGELVARQAKRVLEEYDRLLSLIAMKGRGRT